MSVGSPRATPVKAFQATAASARTSTRKALEDLGRAFGDPELWLTLGWQDIRQRYRRSKLGPFWLTISMGVMIGALGFVYSNLFGMEIRSYLPFLSAGLIIWSLVGAMVSEGCTTFIDARAILREVHLPLTSLALRTLWRALIIFGHNIVIYGVVAVVCKVNPSPAMFLAPIGLALAALNGLWIIMMLGLLCARFRDMPQMISSLLQLAFFVTPIIWAPAQHPALQAVSLVNPMYHLVEVVRAPLLGQPPALSTWVYLAAMLVVGWAATFTLFKWTRWRVPYWL